MATIIQVEERLRPLTNRETLELFLFVEIKRFENLFLKAQKEQLNDGENNKGGVIGTYSFATEQIAKNENPRKPKNAGEAFNFEYHGDFFDGMYLDVFEDRAEFWSRDDKTKKLTVKYNDLFGLQPDRLMELVRRVILPALQLQFRKHLQL